MAAPILPGSQQFLDDDVLVDPYGESTLQAQVVQQRDEVVAGDARVRSPPARPRA